MAMFAPGVKLSPAHHTGRRLPHQHTSWAAVAFIVLVAGVLLTAATRASLAVGEAVNPQSGYYGVTGIMPGSPPQKAPVILHPTTGQTFASLPITVDGLCDKTTVVQIYRNDIFSGTAACGSDGNFTLQIDLFDGTNRLVARAYDALGQASPDSTAVSVTFHLANSLNNFTNQVGLPLFIKADPIARGAKVGRAVQWQFEIGGGKLPYAVSIDWGDGKTDLLPQQTDSVLSLEHVYQQPGIKTIVIKVTDAATNRAYLQVLTVVDGQTKLGLAQAISGDLAIAWPIYIVVALMFVSFWCGELYRKWKDLPQLPGTPV
jgi:hypothetical protein